MNDSRFSVYPGEQEVLLSEGFSVYVLAVEDEVKISNKFLPKYDG